MDTGAIREGLSKYWPYALGVVGGLYLLMKYKGGSQPVANVDPTAQLMAGQAAMAAQAGQNAVQMQQAQLQSDVANAQLSNQNNVQTMAGIAAYNDSIGTTAQAAATGISQIIAAQSYLPAQAINSATLDNQSALAAGAQVAMANTNATAAAQIGIVRATQGIATGYMDAMSSAYQSFSNSVSNSVNAVGSASGNSANAAAASAAAAQQANAQKTQAQTQAISSIAMMALL
jgi:hypothetical protein